MLKMILRQLFILFVTCFINKQTFAISGEEISIKVSNWLYQKGITGTPMFSPKRIYKDCNKIEISNMFENYNTIKVRCLDKNGFEILMRINNLKFVNGKPYSNAISNQSTILKIKKNKNKVNKSFKTLKLKRSLEKNDIIQLKDIELFIPPNKYQKYFFSNKNELVGRKLKKNLKKGQIIFPRHLYKKFEINNGDNISIVSNVGKASVTVSGEAQASGNLGDLIKVKNLKSGKIVKGYIKKNKIIKIFR